MIEKQSVRRNLALKEFGGKRDTRWQAGRLFDPVHHPKWRNPINSTRRGSRLPLRNEIHRMRRVVPVNAKTRPPAT